MNIIYNVTISIDYDVKADWLEWMKRTHIPDVMATGMFTEAKISKILAEESGGASYSIQYLCNDLTTYDKYTKEFAPKLQQDHNDKFGGKFAAFRTILKVEENFVI